MKVNKIYFARRDEATQRLLPVQGVKVPALPARIELYVPFELAFDVKDEGLWEFEFLLKEPMGRILQTSTFSETFIFVEGDAERQKLTSYFDCSGNVSIEGDYVGELWWNNQCMAALFFAVDLLASHNT